MPPAGTNGRSLEDTQQAATHYVNADPKNRFLMPFGLKSKPGENYFDLFREALLEVLGLANPPKRLWLVAGSGFILNVLHSIWPSTMFMIVQVGKRVWPDQYEDKKAQLFVAPEKFGEMALQQPPFPTVPWYDAKLWQFAVENWEEGDAIWNVGAVPENPLLAAQNTIRMINEIEVS